MNTANDKRLFWACFVMLIATAFGFVVRTMIQDDLARQFGWTETQKGEVIGAWFWPFGVSIILFSLIIDKIGYGRAVVFALVCHITSTLLAIYSTKYYAFYCANLIGALGNGTVEAVINPVVATMFVRDKTKWLNILHAGWPGGLVIGGILAIFLGDQVPANWVTWGATIGLNHVWQFKLALVFIPVVLYALLVIGCKFPINERVAAGISYRSMLQEAGLLSVLVALSLIVIEVTRVFEEMKWIFDDAHWNNVLYHLDIPHLGVWDITQKAAVKIGLIVIPALAFFLYVLSFGRLLFFFLVIIMIPLATTEIGTDTWITDLMRSEMKALSDKVGFTINSGWVLVWTSFIMMVLRFFAGPIAHKFSPLGLLAISAAIAAIGLFSLSMAVGLFILGAATLYGFGKTFFWPTMLGVASEQCPKGGALTLNMLGGIGMIGVGIIGNPLLGNIQDKYIDAELLKSNPALYKKVMASEKASIFGAYHPLDAEKVNTLAPAETEALNVTKESSKKNALRTVAIFPVFMFVCYVILILYFKLRGGYKPVILAEHGVPVPAGATP